MKSKILALIAGLALTGAADAATINLPDEAVFVNPNYGNTTTIVVVNGVTYKGASNFVYFSECAKPDGPRYHCNIEVESVVLVSPNGNVAVVEGLAVQFAGTLIISGHNYWRDSQIVLSGQVTIQ